MCILRWVSKEDQRGKWKIFSCNEDKQRKVFFCPVSCDVILLRRYFHFVVVSRFLILFSITEQGVSHTHQREERTKMTTHVYRFIFVGISLFYVCPFFSIVTFLWLKGGAKENESVASKYLMNFVIVFFHDHTRKDYLHVHSAHAQMKPIFYSMDNLTNKEINCEK